MALPKPQRKVESGFLIIRFIAMQWCNVIHDKTRALGFNWSQLKLTGLLQFGYFRFVQPWFLEQVFEVRIAYEWHGPLVGFVCNSMGCCKGNFVPMIWEVSFWKEYWVNLHLETQEGGFSSAIFFFFEPQWRWTGRGCLKDYKETGRVGFVWV